MKRPSNRVWASFALLSIVVPVGLLATFRLTGVFKEPSKPENVTLELVSLNIVRPTRHVEVWENISNVYATDEFFGSLTVDALSYWENSGMIDYNDGLWLRLTAMANTSRGVINSMSIESSVTDEHAVFDIIDDSDNIELSNLARRKLADGSHLRGALFEAVGVDQPKECTLELKPLWWFFDQNNVEHWITITLEILYFNGELYRQVSAPIRLGVKVP